jgi:hypothetical protein
VKTKKKPRVASIRIEQFHDMDAVCSWASGALVFKEFSNGELVKKVRIGINDPADVAYLREHLDKIVAGWKESLGRLS